MAFDTSGIRLKPCVDLFSTEASRQDAGLEKIREIPLDQLIPFKDHPFKVIDDESMMDTVQSIREHGILLPLIARPCRMANMRLYQGTAEAMPESWLVWKPCRSSSENSTTIPPSS